MNRTWQIVLIILILQGCNIGANNTSKNEHIDERTRASIGRLNDRLFKAVINSDVATIKTLSSDKLLENSGDSLDILIKKVRTLFSTQTYSVMDEYNVHHANIGDNILPASVIGEDDYTINYKPLTKEAYISLLVPDSQINDILITVIYGKYGKGWKINILHFGQYSVFKKNAADYYKIAQENYEKKFLIDAVNNIILAKQCLAPAGNYIKYRKEDEINKFYDKVLKEANEKYKLPLTLESIDTKPEVFRVFPEMINEGIFPMVYYLSKISLDDTTALKAENEKVQKETTKTFRGISKNKKYVFYWAFNQMPDGINEVRHYGFIQQN